jgi:plastocyanin
MLLPKMISRRIACIFVVAAIAAIFSLAIAMSLFVPFSSLGQQEAAAQQQNDTTTTTTTNQSIMPPASSNKTFSIFSTEVQGLEETYIYSLPVIVANRGDNVAVNLHNTEETQGGGTEATEGRHSFTIDAQPYSVDIDTAAGESGNATFTADQEGIFPYYCKYHPQTMTGQLVVLAPPSPAAASQPAT